MNEERAPRRTKFAKRAERGKTMKLEEFQQGSFERKPGAPPPSRKTLGMIHPNKPRQTVGKIEVTKSVDEGGLMLNRHRSVTEGAATAMPVQRHFNPSRNNNNNNYHHHQHHQHNGQHISKPRGYGPSKESSNRFGSSGYGSDSQFVFRLTGTDEAICRHTASMQFQTHCCIVRDVEMEQCIRAALFQTDALLADHCKRESASIVAARNEATAEWLRGRSVAEQDQYFSRNPHISRAILGMSPVGDQDTPSPSSTATA